MKRFFTIGFVVLTLAMAGGMKALAQRATVTIKFTNQTPHPLVLKRMATAANSGVPASGTGLSPGATTTGVSAPGEIWVVLSGGNPITQYTATNKAKQKFSIKGAPPAGREGDPAPAVAGNTGSQVTADEARQIVAYHNLKRREVGSPDLAWSAEIARYAQERADMIAKTKKFSHLPQGRNPYGENLAQRGTTGGVSGYTVISACDDWFAEQKKMPGGVRVMTVDLFNRGVGHYTQMVWSGSTQLGAGAARFQQNGFTMTVVVCCYNPPGNLINGAIYAPPSR